MNSQSINSNLTSYRSFEFEFELSMNNHISDFGEFDDGGEDSLSFCDLPIFAEESQSQSYLESHSEPEIFGFFTDFEAKITPADEIIHSGEKSISNKPKKETETEQSQIQISPILRRRSESLNELQRSKSKGSKTRVMRTSRSLDYRKLSSATGSDRESSINCFGKSDAPKASVPGTPTKSPWQLLMFGLVKFPPEMDMRDIKNRQIRRNPATLFPSLIAGDKVVAHRSDGKRSWGILRALSCRDDSSTAVTASYACISGA